MARWKIVGSVAIVAISVAAAVAGGIHGGGTLGSASSAGAAAAIATPTPAPTSRAHTPPARQSQRFDPPPVLDMPYADAQGGYWLELPGFWRRIGSLYGYGRQACVLDFCVEGVSVVHARARTGIELGLAEPGSEPIVVSGGNLRKVKESWRTAFPDAEFSALSIDGTPAILATTAAGKQRSVLVLRDGRLFSISAHSLFGIGTRDLLQTFLRGFHFMPAACWIEPCQDDGWSSAPDLLVTFDKAGRWTSEGRTWGYGPGPADRSTAGFASTQCFADLCTGYVSVTIGTASTGPVVDRIMSSSGVSWARATGATLAEVTASTAEIVGATKVDRITVDGARGRHLIADGREVVILEHRGRFIVITAFDGFSQQNAKQNLADFLKGFGLVG